MKEIRYGGQRPPIRRVADLDLNRDLFRIACYFHASASLSSPEDEVGRMPALQLLAEECQESEIVSSLLHAAMRIRLLDEQLWDKSVKVQQQFACNTGLLWEPETAPQAIDLSTREACNKIVHAADICFFVDECQYNSKSLPPRFLLPRVALYGNRGRIAWRAELSVNEFVEAGYWLANYA